MRQKPPSAVTRRAALGLTAALAGSTALVGTATAAHAEDGSPAGDVAGPAPKPVHGLRATGELGRIRLSWAGEAFHPLVDHYAVYAGRSSGFAVGPQTLLGKTVYSYFRHERLGGRRQDWHYRVVTVDAAGNRSEPSAEVLGSSLDSVTVTGQPVATLGEFDQRSLEFALAPNASSQFLTRFPNGVDVTHGVHGTADWSYIHPGPADSWAGRREHRFTFRFTLDTPPAAGLWLAIWLIDTHASLPGTVALGLNGAPVREVALEGGATRGSLEGDATLPDSPLKPSYVEVALPAATLVAGTNVLTIDKTVGSWHVYDALGVFRR
ncbi:Polysaccharide lyase family 4, domain III [Micromonospora citrea]|uniref:Polysaccharide lyase family 4, domain III n=1 Tax=Micromonospora citrea TaxID=47855 RepID=A0A1C6W2T8_9ACTN|nr:polysaccharide lyase family protein [Micromonospora citrea]SCL72826.1 Polysaccharide lyase family 4, domain III [Micromonospora citrea]